MISDYCHADGRVLEPDPASLVLLEDRRDPYLSRRQGWEYIAPQHDRGSKRN